MRTVTGFVATMVGLASVVLVGAASPAQAASECRSGNIPHDWIAPLDGYGVRLDGPWGTKIAQLRQGRISDNTYGIFTSGYNSRTDRIWLDYRRQGASGWTQCGPSKSRRSQYVDTYDPVRRQSRQARVCIDTLYGGNRHHHCGGWFTD
jgi:hypothetical protein